MCGGVAVQKRLQEKVQKVASAVVRVLMRLSVVLVTENKQSETAYPGRYSDARRSWANPSNVSDSLHGTSVTYKRLGLRLPTFSIP